MLISIIATRMNGKLYVLANELQFGAAFHTTGAPEIWIHKRQKTLKSWRQCKLTGKALMPGTFSSGVGIKYSLKGIYNSKHQ